MLRSVDLYHRSTTNVCGSRTALQVRIEISASFYVTVGVLPGQTAPDAASTTHASFVCALDPKERDWHRLVWGSVAGTGDSEGLPTLSTAVPERRGEFLSLDRTTPCSWARGADQSEVRTPAPGRAPRESSPWGGERGRATH